MAEQVKTIHFTKNAKDQKTGIAYAAGQDVTVLDGVAKRMVKAEVAKETNTTPDDPRTMDELKKAAKQKNVEGYASMNKAQLIAAVDSKEAV
jgi:hypothetical protein